MRPSGVELGAPSALQSRILWISSLFGSHKNGIGVAHATNTAPTETANIKFANTKPLRFSPYSMGSGARHPFAGPRHSIVVKISACSTHFSFSVRCHLAEYTPFDLTGSPSAV